VVHFILAEETIRGAEMHTITCLSSAMVVHRGNSALPSYRARIQVHFIVAEELAAQLNRAQARLVSKQRECLASEALPLFEAEVNSP
jgi:hypothetical protein